MSDTSFWARLRRGLRWLFWRHLCFGGLVGALLFFIVSVSPSLLPRGWLFQGIVSGISIVIGYGIGSAVSAIARRFDPPEPSPDAKRWFWRGLLAAAVIAVPLSLWWGNTWNQNTREIMGMEDLDTWQWLPINLVALVVAGIVLIISRGVRMTARLIGRLFNRWLPRRTSTAIGVVGAALILWGLLSGVLFDGLVSAMNSTYSLTDGGTTPGISQPSSELRSGSEASLVEWDDLGTQGRDFTGEGFGEEKQQGPTAADIEEFTGEPAEEPIRVYVGLKSASSLDDRVDLALQELERTNAFDREVLAIYASTGTGWIDEKVADSIEYMWGGDTAAVGMQYSYLPSWVSILVDQTKAVDTSDALIEAVTRRVGELPEDEQPQVLLFGESLGSFATEGAFEGLDELQDSVDGAMLVGPTFVNDLRNEFTENRDDPSPEWLPVYEEGDEVRFIVEPDDLGDLPEGSWEEPRLLYLQNASDPISHFRLELLWEEPDWLDEPRAPDANPDMSWFPFVTFWQVVADLTYSFGAPAGHGHRYGANVVDGWAAIAAPDGWTDADTERLREIIGDD